MNTPKTEALEGVRELPELPPLLTGIAVGYGPIYTADQMREYGKRCAEAGRQTVILSGGDE